MPNICGAKTRAKGQCQSRPMPNGRCRMHGGTNKGAPLGSANAKIHGIYARHLTADEQVDYAALKLGTVEDELRLTKIRLSRALNAEKLADGKPELEEVTQNDGGGVAVPHETRRSRVKDYASIINTLLGRIESLEKTRAALMSDDPAQGQHVTGFEVVPYED